MTRAEHGIEHTLFINLSQEKIFSYSLQCLRSKKSLGFFIIQTPTTYEQEARYNTSSLIDTYNNYSLVIPNLSIIVIVIEYFSNNKHIEQLIRSQKYEHGI